MFERFTKRSRQVMVFCQDEARLLGHTVILPHHILLGLLRLESELPGPAGPIRQLGLDPAELRELVTAEANESGGSGAPGDNPKFTLKTKRVLESSLREALQLGNNFISPGHMLLALVREDTPKVFAERVDIKRARLAVQGYHRLAPEAPEIGTRGPRRGLLEVLKAVIPGSATGEPPGTQDILLTLVSRTDTLAGKILAELGVTEEKVRELIEKIGTAGTIDEPPQPEYEVRVGEHVIRVDHPESRDLLRRILDDDPPLAARIRDAIERRAKESDS